MRSFAVAVIVIGVGVLALASSRIYEETGFMKGMTFGAMYWPEEQLPWVDYNLERLRATGVNAIALVVDWYVDTYADPTVEPWYRDQSGFPDTHWYFPTLYDSEVRHIIQKAHSLGMTVLLKPHVETLNWASGAPGRYALQEGVGRWDELFESYTDYMLHYAAICEDLGVEILSLGCELESMTHHAPEADRRWRELIADVRAVYSGELTYSCSFHGTPSQTWSSPNNITFWDALDYIGFEIYRGLTWKRSPTVAELKAGVHDIFDRFVKPLAEEFGIPVIVPEINYYSYDGVNTTPIDPPGSRVVDHQEQADCYDAVLEAVEEILTTDDYLEGLFWWAGYLVDPADDEMDDTSWVETDRYDPIWFKPAEQVLREHWHED
jgi:hypothetical protein